jgi:hypothetical protein
LLVVLFGLILLPHAPTTAALSVVAASDEVVAEAVAVSEIVADVAVGAGVASVIVAVVVVAVEVAVGPRTTAAVSETLKAPR